MYFIQCQTSAVTRITTFSEQKKKLPRNSLDIAQLLITNKVKSKFYEMLNVKFTGFFLKSVMQIFL